MNDKYAGSEILHMAVEIEKKGKEFYQSVVQSQKDEKAQKVFNFLIDEEERDHIHRILNLKKDLQV